MKKTALVTGSIEIVLGLLTVATTSVLNQLVPILGYLVFKSQPSGSYSAHDFIMNFAVANTIAAVLCILGVATIVYFVFIRKETK